MSRPRTALLGLLAVTSVAVPAPVPKALKAKAFVLDGKWETVERVNKGQAIKETWVWELNGETLTPYYRGPGATLRATYNDASLTFSRPDSGKADEFDYRYSSKNSILLYRGRVAWDGDEWVFCFGEAGGERPTEVKAGKDVYYLRFKRMSDK